MKREKGLKCGNRDEKDVPGKQSILTWLIIPKVGVCCPLQGCTLCPGIAKDEAAGNPTVSVFPPPCPATVGYWDW